MKNRLFLILLVIVVAISSLTGCMITDSTKESTTTNPTTTDNVAGAPTTEPTSVADKETSPKPTQKEELDTLPVGGDKTASFDISQVPAYNKSPFAVVNGNKPYFRTEELVKTSYESYAKLDTLGRCGVTIACVGKDIMPTEDRGQIGSVKPTGWHTVKYDCVDGKYLYNRCHLIGFQLTGENANTANLITGTRYMNVDGMLPFENMVADYVKETENHVMYRVTPIFEGSNLVATGVLMEAFSVEDNGDGIMFCVFCYNVQPGVDIDYSTGKSTLADAVTDEEPSTKAGELYILNTSSKKFHSEDCSSLPKENRQDYIGTREEVINMGYSPCGSCKP